MHVMQQIFKIATMAAMVGSCASVFAATVHLRILETTDIHANVSAFDYFKNRETDQFGLVRAASLIRAARKEVSNTVLVDNGDLLQGSPMGDYMAAHGLHKGELHPAYKVMNPLGYDVGNVGNHDFNYGLAYLKEATDGAQFPYVSANVVDADSGKTLFSPYVIKSKTFIDTDGHKQTVKVGYIGFVPPQIMQWDRKNLEGKVKALDIIETARKLVPQMRAQGADVVVAIAHSGLSDQPYTHMAENVVWQLSQIDGIDALAFGHAHGVFPGSSFAGRPGIDIDKGTINGVPAVMAGRWGSHVGVIDLVLDNRGGHWQVSAGQAAVRAIFDRGADTPLVDVDTTMMAAIAEEHNKTRSFMNEPAGKSASAMYSYLALVQDDPTIQIVNDAQKAYVEKMIGDHPELQGIPVLSAMAPFKVGGRKNDPTNFTEVEKGTLSRRNIADLYLYPNVLVALKLTGKQVREWLERSAGQFNRVDVDSRQPQHLLNWETFRTYNFDVIDGVDYQIDVTKPARYDANGMQVSDSHRIVGLTYAGRPVRDAQPFILATNNYRAYGGGQFPGSGEDAAVLVSPDSIRTILARYIAEQTRQHTMVAPVADNNWKLAAVSSQQPLSVLFETSPSDKAAKFIAEHARYRMTQKGIDNSGFALYQIDLR